MQAFLVRDYIDLVIADTYEIVCTGGKGFLPDLAMRRVLSRQSR